MGRGHTHPGDLGRSTDGHLAGIARLGRAAGPDHVDTHRDHVDADRDDVGSHTHVVHADADVLHADADVLHADADVLHADAHLLHPHPDITATADRQARVAGESAARAGR